MNFVFDFVINLSCAVIVALSLNVLVGYCGLLSLAHAAFFMLGAYTYAVVSMAAPGLPFPLGLLAAMTVGAIGSILLAVPSRRLTRDSFVLLSLAIGSVLGGVFDNWWAPGAAPGSWRNLTNGHDGLSNVSPPVLLGREFRSTGEIAVIAVLLAVTVGWVYWRLLRSPWGRLLIAMRDDEIALRALGKNTWALKFQAMAIFSATVAAAGALWASYARFLTPDRASFDESVSMLSIVLIGGAGSFRGAIVGSLFVTGVWALTRPFPGALMANMRIVFYGVLLILLMLLRPRGLAGRYDLS